MYSMLVLMSVLVSVMVRDWVDHTSCHTTDTGQDITQGLELAHNILFDGVAPGTSEMI